MTFDFTLRVPELLAFGGVGFGVFKGWLAMRDSQRDILRALGTKDPPDGLLGDVEHLKITATEHREWLIAAGLDRRSGSERRDWRVVP